MSKKEIVICASGNTIYQIIFLDIVLDFGEIEMKLGSQILILLIFKS